MDETKELAEQAWGLWQGWGVTAWLVLGLVALFFLRRYVMRMVRRRIARVVMAAALATYFGGTVATLSVGDYVGPQADAHCAAVEAETTSAANLPATGICRVRGAIVTAVPPYN